MREAWRLCFNKPMQGEKAPEPSRGQILPLEPWIHPYTHGDEEKWWDSVLNAFPARLGKGWEAKFEAVDCMEDYDALAGGFACSRPRDALGRDGLHDPALLEIMLERGSEAMESGFLLPGDLLSPEFPLHSAADVLLLAGYQISAAHALDWNRGTIAYNILAGYSGKSHEPRPIISRGSTADPSKIDRNSQGSQGRRRSQQPRPDLPRRTTANSKILERCSMRNDRVSILPNHLSILPNHLSILPDRFFKLPDHLSILPDRFSKLPDHSSILPDRFSQSL